MHALSGGVLFRSGFAPRSGGIAGYATPPTPSGLFPNLVDVHSQGARELVALSGVLEAYRRISGDYKRTEGEKSSNTETSERTSGIKAATRDLAAPVVSLLTGGLTGAGLAISGTGGAATVFATFATALGASLVFKATKTRKRERSASRDAIHLRSVGRDAGSHTPHSHRAAAKGRLAPVFVVDELDKVTGLSTRIVSMVHHLKKLVAENAFFCFLTNRSYFEEMLAESSGRPYPVEYTYYTHRLFVVFSPEDFERYLRSRIRAP